MLASLAGLAYLCHPTTIPPSEQPNATALASQALFAKLVQAPGAAAKAAPVPKLAASGIQPILVKRGTVLEALKFLPAQRAQEVSAQ